MSRLPRYRPVKRCAFCPNKATSWEHAWPNWALKKASSRRVVFGEVAGKEHFDPNQQAIRVKCVCGDCNGGWMKALEDEVKPIASPMMAGVAFQLSESDRDVLTRWAVKNAMVWEHVTGPERPLFYSDKDRLAFREHRTIPCGTRVQIAHVEGLPRFEIYGVHGETDAEDPAARADGFVVTMVFGRLALQVFTLRARRAGHVIEVSGKPGPWNHVLRVIWPPVESTMEWPPPHSLGTYVTIRDVHRMWGVQAE